MAQQRIKSFDVIKGMMIFLVVLGHLSLFCYKYPSQPVIYKIFTAFHVPVFFFVAGMFFSLDKRQTMLGKAFFILKKAIYLIIPSLFFYVLYYYSHNLDPLSAISDGFGVYWFLPCLFFSFLMIFILEVFSKPFSRSFSSLGNFLLLFSIAIGTFFTLKGIDLGEKMGWLQLYHLASYYPYMAFGYLYRKNKSLGKKILKNEIVIVLAIVYVFISFVISQSNYRELIPESVFSLILLFRVYFLTYICLSCFFHYQGRFEKNNWFNNFFALVGKYTLPIYVLHYFFLPDLTWLRKIMGDDSTVLVYLILITIAVAIIGLCLIFTKVVSRSYFLGHYLLGQKSDRFKY